jgi:hybrid cluster-associated redox disulfide protein
LSLMDTNIALQANMTVEDVLRKWPETWTVFMSKRTDCVGCFMQRFCTLQDVAETYQISVEVLTRELESCVIQSKNTQRSTT